MAVLAVVLGLGMGFVGGVVAVPPVAVWAEDLLASEREAGKETLNSITSKYLVNCGNAVTEAENYPNLKEQLELGYTAIDSATTSDEITTAVNTYKTIIQLEVNKVSAIVSYESYYNSQVLNVTDPTEAEMVRFDEVYQRGVEQISECTSVEEISSTSTARQSWMLVVQKKINAMRDVTSYANLDSASSDAVTVLEDILAGCDIDMYSVDIETDEQIADVKAEFCDYIDQCVKLFDVFDSLVKNDIAVLQAEYPNASSLVDFTKGHSDYSTVLTGVYSEFTVSFDWTYNGAVAGTFDVPLGEDGSFPFIITFSPTNIGEFCQELVFENDITITATPMTFYNDVASLNAALIEVAVFNGIAATGENFAIDGDVNVPTGGILGLSSGTSLTDGFSVNVAMGGVVSNRSGEDFTVVTLNGEEIIPSGETVTIVATDETANTVIKEIFEKLERDTSYTVFNGRDDMLVLGRDALSKQATAVYKLDSMIKAYFREQGQTLDITAGPTVSASLLGENSNSRYIIDSSGKVDVTGLAFYADENTTSVEMKVEQIGFDTANKEISLDIKVYVDGVKVENSTIVTPITFKIDLPAVFANQITLLTHYSGDNPTDVVETATYKLGSNGYLTHTVTEFSTFTFQSVGTVSSNSGGTSVSYDSQEEDVVDDVITPEIENSFNPSTGGFYKN